MHLLLDKKWLAKLTVQTPSVYTAVWGINSCIEQPYPKLAGLMQELSQPATHLETAALPT